MSTRQEQLDYLKTIRSELGYNALNKAFDICDYGHLTITEMSYVMDESTSSIRRTEEKITKLFRAPSIGKKLKLYLLEKITIENSIAYN